MELGATVCFRQKPACLTCPVREFCAAAKHGEPEAYPRLAPKKMERREVVRVWCVRGGKILLHRAADESRRLAGQHELPTAAQAGLMEAAAARGKLIAKKKRGITRFQITETIHAVPPPRGKHRAGLLWVPLAKLETITLSGPHRRWVKEILGVTAGKGVAS